MTPKLAVISSTVSVGVESRNMLSRTPCFGGLSQSAVKLSAGTLTSWVQPRRVCSQAHSVFLGGILLLISCQTECLSSLLSIGRGHPFFSAVADSAPEPIQCFLVGFASSSAVGQKVSSSLHLLAEDILSSPQCGSLHRASLWGRARKNMNKMGTTVFCDLITECSPSLATFCWLEENLSWLGSHIRRGDY